MQRFRSIQNIVIDGDEFTAAAVAAHRVPATVDAWNKSKYETDTIAILSKWLLTSWTAWAVLTEVFHRNQKTMFIRPYRPTPSGGQFNATAGALDPKAATQQGTAAYVGQGFGSATTNSKVVTGRDFYQGFKIKIEGRRGGQRYSMGFKYRLDSPTQITLLAYSSSFGDDSSDVKWEGDTGNISWIVEGGQSIVGTGTGSDTEIRFSPYTFSAPGAPTGPGAQPDEILLHEMVHGLRQMMGRAVFEQVDGNPGMDNYEEFAAIVVSNVYRSEMGTGQLRQDHHGFVALTGPSAVAATFKTTYQRYLLDMDIEQPRFCANLRRVSCTFNPFV